MTVALLLSGGAAYRGRSASVRTTRATKASKVTNVEVPARCDALDAQMDSAIARGPQSGPALAANLTAERLALQNAGCPAEPDASLTTTTSASSVLVGNPITDTANLVGDSPTGQITFTVFKTNNCTGVGTTVAPVVTVTGDGAYTSGSYTPAAAGSYSFRASYSGDVSNPAVTSACEPFTVTSPGSANPTLTTTLASSTVGAGQPFSDSATLSGGSSPTGQIGFTLFSIAAGHDCSSSGPGTPIATVNVTGGNGTYSSGTFTIPTAGNYAVRAYYAGDANNNTAASACEPFTVT